MVMQWNYLCLIVQYLSATSQILSRVMSSWSGWRGHSGKIAVLNNSWSTWDLLHQLPIISPQGFCTSWSWFTRSAGGMHELHVHLGCLKASRTSNFHQDYPYYLDDWIIGWLDNWVIGWWWWWTVAIAWILQMLLYNLDFTFDTSTTAAHPGACCKVRHLDVTESLLSEGLRLDLRIS